MTFPALFSPKDVPPGSLLLDARPGAGTFTLGHLPGAVHADWDTILSSAKDPGHDPALGGRHPLPALERWAAQLGAWGVTPGTWVVAYDDAGGGNGAARAWWMLRALGHERAAILDGGLQAGLEAGLSAPALPPAPPYPGGRWLRPTVTLAEVDRLRRDPAWKVLDVRAGFRYRGESEPIDPVAGHIPGALNLPFAENLDARGRFKPAAELRRMYRDLLGGTGPDHLVVHCGSGITACHTLFALELAGLDGASLYVGSWGEWCRNPMPREPNK
jgi:thiosulfate/3-mercaptopyruvate sulfurtransferase